MSINAGDRVNNFTLQNENGDKVSLTDLNDGSKVVLLFFPLAFSSTCTEEMCQIRDNMKLYDSLRVNVAGISADSFFTLKEFKKANNLNFTLLSDYNKEISRYFGCMYDDYYGMKGVPKRSAFVINSDNIVEFAEILEDSSKLPDLKAVKSAIRD